MALALSVVLPLHNEERVLEPYVLAIERHLDTSPLVDEFEVLLVCNGCVDRSEEIARHLAATRPQRIRTLSLPTRGLGHAIREGIRAAAHPTVMFYAVDLPFGLAVFDDSVAAALGNPDAVVIGSKGHPRSRVERRWTRQLFSRTISFANNALFGLHVRDTQGSLLFPRRIFERHHAMMDSAGPFFQAQIVIYGSRMGYNVLEIPVTLTERGGRKTRLKLAVDGGAYLRDLCREKLKLMKESERR
jgi:glycosyltransferase involved in cell wall biosynthesis